MPDWYDCIEPGVRGLVRHLRNEGFNTVDPSCARFTDRDDCEIAFYWQGQQQHAEARLRMPDGKPNPGWRGGCDWAGYRYVSETRGSE